MPTGAPLATMGLQLEVLGMDTCHPYITAPPGYDGVSLQVVSALCLPDTTNVGLKLLSPTEAYKVFCSKGLFLLVVHVTELCLKILLMVTIECIWQAFGAINAENGHQDVSYHGTPHHLGGHIRHIVILVLQDAHKENSPNSSVLGQRINCWFNVPFVQNQLRYT